MWDRVDAALNSLRGSFAEKGIELIFVGMEGATVKVCFDSERALGEEEVIFLLGCVRDHLKKEVPEVERVELVGPFEMWGTAGEEGGDWEG